MTHRTLSAAAILLAALAPTAVPAAEPEIRGDRYVAEDGTEYTLIPPKEEPAAVPAEKPKPAPKPAPRYYYHRDCTTDNAWSIGGFYCAPVSGAEIGLWGICGRWTSQAQHSVDEAFAIRPEYFLDLSFGGGNSTETLRGHSDVDVTVLSIQFAFGGNLRMQLSEYFSGYAGARIGVEAASVDIEYSKCLYDWDTEAPFGLIYGIGAGVQWNFSGRNCLVLGVDWIATTATASFDYWGDIDVPSRLQISLSYEYKF